MNTTAILLRRATRIVGQDWVYILSVFVIHGRGNRILIFTGKENWMFLGFFHIQMLPYTVFLVQYSSDSLKKIPAQKHTKTKGKAGGPPKLLFY